MNENEWTLEQRLASHLSRALNQENDANSSQSNQSVDAYMDPALTGANQWNSWHTANNSHNSYGHASRQGMATSNSYSHHQNDQDSLLSQASVSRLLDFINQPQDDGSKDASSQRAGISSLASSALQSNGLNIPASLQPSAYTSNQQSLAHQLPNSYNPHANQLQQTLASNAVNAQYTASLLSSQIQANAINAQLKSNLLNAAGTAPSSYTATPQFEIDSEVADIRNVLQSLLDPNVANKVLTDQQNAQAQAQQQTPTASSSASGSGIHGINAATSRSLLGTDFSGLTGLSGLSGLSGLTSTTDFSNLTLSAETESLRAKIEASLRKEFNIPAVTPAQPAIAPPSAPVHTPLPRTDITPVKRTYRRRKPSVEYTPPASDLNAETDTLRAIQQALLGAINPESSAEGESSSPSSSLTSNLLSGMSDIRFDANTSSENSPGKSSSRDLRKSEKLRGKTKRQELSKDEELRAKVAKRANATYGANPSREKEMFIEDEIARRKRKINIQDSISAILAKERESRNDESAVSLETVSAQLHAVPTTRRLARHTKEAASNHLSQLFKKSNSILEPRMHKEKTAVPVSPYILMSFPKRPKFKVQPPKPQATSPETSIAEPGQPQLTNKPLQTDASLPDALNSQSPSAETMASPSSNTSTDSAEPGKSAGSSVEPEPRIEFVHTKRMQAMRPKHKYSLIGRLDFGAPPNLAAIVAKHQA